MHSFLLGIKTRFSRHTGELASVAIHLVLMLFLVGGIAHSPPVAPYRLPGTVHGDTLLTYYRPGSFQQDTTKAPMKSPEKAKPTTAVHDQERAPQPAQSQAAESHAGVGVAAESGLGEGDITIALETYFPHPTPDLSSLPHGTKGDVILNAVIDEQGNISELTLLKGLGSPVDEYVIATVQQWKYTPAKKNGVPVVSEQELHFHYERG